MTAERVRIGMVGLDHWYTAVPLAEELAARDDVELVAIVHDDSAKAEALGLRVGVSRIGTEPGEIVDDPSIDAVCSFVSVDRNPSICVAAARAGKHLMSIKPVALTLPEASRVVTAVSESGVVFLPAESRMRTSPHNLRLRQWIAEGRIGDVLSATFSMWAPLPRGWQGSADPGWFVDPDRAPGGGWIDHSVYHIDALRWLLDSEVDEVFGSHAKLKYAELGVEDYGHALLRFSNGTLATIEDTWLAPAGGSRISMSLVGRNGAISYDSLSGRLSVAGECFAEKEPPFDGWVHAAPGSFIAGGVDEWLSAIRGSGTCPGTVDDAWSNLAVCRAFYDAAATGGWVRPERR